jgi:hypothetical protein
MSPQPVKPPKPDRTIDLVVVVSGQPTPVRVNSNQTIAHLIHEALQQSGNKGQDPSQWDLRLEGGDLLDPGLRVGDVGLTDGMTLYLNPRAGAGG